MSIIVGKNILKEELSYIEGKKKFLFVDSNVYSLYEDLIEELFSKDTVIEVVQSSESIKNLDIVYHSYEILLRNKFARSDYFITLGGGIVGDIGGYIASTFKRGMKLINIPTTLLSQVDSSIGGKVAVNFNNYKNIVGNFYFSEKTIIDIKFLNTLNTRELNCGIGEVLKVGLIKDYDYFKYCINNLEKLYRFDEEFLLYIIKKSIEIKSFFVDRDKEENNIRKNLNFGHTIGHAVESVYNFERYNHGEAVIIGMIYESYISYKLNFIDYNRFKFIYSNLSLIVEPEAFNKEEIENLLEFIQNDKKNIGSNISIILLNDKGSFLKDSLDKKIIREVLKGDFIEN